MPAPYGVTPTGFSTKTLPEQLAEIEVQMVAAFGPGVVQDPQSPLGQLNGLFADALAEMWELAQALYGSLDVDQASGPRLDALGKLRRIERATGQSDDEYRLAITQSGFGNQKTRTIRNRILEVSGVTSVQVIENSTPIAADSGLDPHSLSIIVQGGDDGEVATAIWENTVAGIGLQGNVAVEVISDGFCQTVSFTRPVLVELAVEVDVSLQLDQCDCAPEDISTMIANLSATLSDECGLTTGATVTPADIEKVVNQNNGIRVEAVRLSRDDTTPLFQNVAFTIEELPVVSAANVTISYVDYAAPLTTQSPSTETDNVISGTDNVISGTDNVVS